MNATLKIADDKRRHHRRAILVAHAPPDGNRGTTVEHDRDFVAEANVLRPLPDVEPNARLALPRIAAVELHDAVLEHETAQRRRQWLAAEHGQVEPAIANLLRSGPRKSE